MKAIIIAGVHKAGTTSLFSYLAQHSLISPSRKKETHYFSSELNGEYLLQFREDFESNGYLLEASPEYIYGKELVAQRIRSCEQLEEVKIIFCLRNPVDKLISNYKHRIKSLNIDKAEGFGSFLDFARNERPHFGYSILEEGVYSDLILYWLEEFGSEAVKIIFSEDLNDDSEGVVHGIFKWLQLDNESINYAKNNVSLSYRSRWLQMVSYSVYMRWELFFRRYPVFTGILKTIYSKVNSASFGAEVDGFEEDIPKEVIDLYESDRKELLGILTDYGYCKFPRWLSHGIS